MEHQFPFPIFLIAFIIYTLLLFTISYFTSRRAATGSFFSGDKRAPWPVIAYGMIGASITGVSFISVPGNVLVQNFYYLPLVFGFIIGYIAIAKILLPLYYRMGLTSIYGYLGQRFGQRSYRTGTVVFMISRLLGAAVRIFVVIVVFYAFIPQDIVQTLSPTIVFAIITTIFIVLLYFYTYKGGVKTIIWTDVLQTTFMLFAIAATIIYICKEMGWTFTAMCSAVINTENSTIPGTNFSDIFDWNWATGTNAIKQFISGIFITIAMTGLDQSMMQKSLACKDIKAAQKNMYTTGINILLVNFFFVILGAILSIFVASKGGMEALGITKTDQIFPTIASNYLGIGIGVIFLIGLISASYPSAGNALTSMTTTFCIDFLGYKVDSLDVEKEHKRKVIHGLFSVLFIVIIMVLYFVSNDAVVNLVYKLASYTYGPMLGLFFFGILTKHRINDKATPYIAIASPLICLLINFLGKRYLGFDLGFSLLIINGVITFVGLWLFKENSKNESL